MPRTIAEKAITKQKEIKNTKQSYAKKDQVWAVFDEDEHPAVKEARDVCKRGNVGIAYSNPCFELWLILHHEEFDRPDDRHQIQRHFNTLCPDYDPDGSK